MHEGHALTDLTHEHDASLLCQDEVIIDDAFKQFAARHAATEEMTHFNFSQNDLCVYIYMYILSLSLFLSLYPPPLPPTALLEQRV